MPQVAIGKRIPTTPNPFPPFRLVGDRCAVAGCTTSSPRLSGAHFRRDAVRSLCPLFLGGTVPRSCVLEHHPNRSELPRTPSRRSSQNLPSTALCNGIGPRTDRLPCADLPGVAAASSSLPSVGVAEPAQ